MLIQWPHRYSKHVHTQVKSLVQRRNLATAYKVETIRRGIEEMIVEYKDQLMEDIDLPVLVKRLTARSPSSSTKDSETASLASIDGDSSLADDLADAKRWEAGESTEALIPELEGSKGGLEKWKSERSFSELEGPMTPLVELDASREIVELPAEVKKGVMEDVSTAKKPHEMLA